MSAFGTKKKGANLAVQLTFPTTFEYAYAASGMPLRYVPSQVGVVHPVEANDFQAQYHRQKKADADHMARAKVGSTVNASNRALVSHQGYYGMPMPVLSQRKYANPSMGALEVASARQDGSVQAPFEFESMSGGAMVGGVLRSAEGQAFGKTRLMERINQLNAISAAKQAFVDGGPAPAPQSLADNLPPQSSSDVDMFELKALFQGVMDAVSGGFEGKSAPLTFADAARGIGLILRIVPREQDSDFIQQIGSLVDATLNLLSGYVDPDQFNSEAATTTAEGDAIVNSLFNLYQRLQIYLQEMDSKVTTLQPKDFMTFSKSLVKRLQLVRFITLNQASLARSDEVDPRVRDGAVNLDSGEDFTEKAPTREDSVARANPSLPFDRDERQTFGYNSGAYFGTNGRESAYFGETPAEGLKIDEEAYVREAPPAPTQTEVSIPEVSRVERDEVTEAPNVVVPKEKKSAYQFEVTRSMITNAKTIKDLDALAKKINEMGGIREDGSIGPGGKSILVYSSGQPANVRKNFYRRLKL